MTRRGSMEYGSSSTYLALYIFRRYMDFSTASPRRYSRNKNAQFEWVSHAMIAFMAIRPMAAEKRPVRRAFDVVTCTRHPPESNHNLFRGSGGEFEQDRNRIWVTRLIEMNHEVYGGNGPCREWKEPSMHRNMVGRLCATSRSICNAS